MFWHTIKCRLKSVHCNAKQRQQKLENRKLKDPNSATIGSGKKNCNERVEKFNQTGGCLGIVRFTIQKLFGIYCQTGKFSKHHFCRQKIAKTYIVDIQFSNKNANVLLDVT